VAIFHTTRHSLATHLLEQGQNSRMHIQVSHPDGDAKFWLSPSIELARNIGLSA
jgi:integrase